jgi:hypothetical protein
VSVDREKVGAVKVFSSFEGEVKLKEVKKLQV